MRAVFEVSCRRELWESRYRQLDVGSQPLTYDPNGNLTSDGVTLYTWNARNQLLALTGPGVTATFSYDALGRRQSRAVNGASTQVLYDGLTPIQEAGSTGIATLLTGAGIDEYLIRTDAAGARTLVTDALGSTVALTDAAGVVQTQYTYAPFGATAVTGPADANAFQYTGREHDGTGLYYYRARYYHPGLQRFLAEDPMEFQAGELNLYAYVMNNPLRYRDPYGLALDDWTGFPTKEEHLDRNRHNQCPWTPPLRPSKSSDREWSQDPWGARKYRAADGSECVYDSKGNLLPGEGTYNYGGGRNPWTVPHIWKDVIPHFWYGGNYAPYYDPEGSKYGP